MISPNKKKLHLRIWVTIAQIGIVILSSVVGVYFFEKVISNLSESVYQKHKLAYNIENRKKVLESLAVDLARLQPHEKALRDVLPPGNNILKFIETIEDLAKQNGIKQVYSFGVPTVPEGTDFPLSKIDFTLTLRANAPTLRAYLSDLLSLPYIVKVNSVFLATPDGWNTEGNATINATFFVKEPE